MKAADHPGRFVRLSRLWDAVQRICLKMNTGEVLLPIMTAHGALQLEELGTSALPVCEDCRECQITSFVHALADRVVQLTSQWSKDDYSDAIVNIFTRLNTAGRTLTREEITLAWLKVGWDPKLTSDQSAAKCLESLQTALEPGVPT
ncbi:MAG: hypothetical protein IPJ34_40935 [Myxococcales bacterium]|nr:hypothetical protein [Myxococcales bacterium]